MKKVLASLKKITGLKVPDPLHKMWMRVFSAKLPKSYASVPRGTSLYVHLKEFNIEGVSESAVYTQASAIEATPASFLPTLFHFEQPISRHYFEFCNDLTKEERISRNSIANDVMPHIIRLLICFDYQLRSEWERILEGKESEVFPLRFLSDYLNLLKALFSLNTSELVDAIVVIRPTLSFIEEQFSIVMARPPESHTAKFVRAIEEFVVEVEVRKKANANRNTGVEEIERRVDLPEALCVSWIDIQNDF